ncbi:hypothetical protein [uncultured Maribacter sp.]|uniref:hypothetical protein n=1 Tax=uncultured Maribacter sp. TaxID=431308 RepID=UPI0026354DA7|nr:hypothetical protein [uncultured Maribacter sp.]
MKKLLVGIVILFSMFGFSQTKRATDSLKLRVFNNGKYLIKELKINIEGKEYAFKDILKNKYSESIKLPYIWNYGNSLTTTVIIKKMFAYDWWVTSEEMPIDHIGDKKIENGEYTLSVKTRMKKKQLDVERELIKWVKKSSQ